MKKCLALFILLIIVLTTFTGCSGSAADRRIAKTLTATAWQTTHQKTDLTLIFYKEKEGSLLRAEYNDGEESIQESFIYKVESGFLSLTYHSISKTVIKDDQVTEVPIESTNIIDTGVYKVTVNEDGTVKLNNDKLNKTLTLTPIV